MLYRIYFDANDGTMSEGYSLCTGSLRDIKPIADRLKEGMRVVIYMTGELEMEATLRFDRGTNIWIARPIEATLNI